MPHHLHPQARSWTAPVPGAGFETGNRRAGLQGCGPAGPPLQGPTPSDRGQWAATPANPVSGNTRLWLAASSQSPPRRRRPHRFGIPPPHDIPRVEVRRACSAPPERECRAVAQPVPSVTSGSAAIRATVAPERRGSVAHQVAQGQERGRWLGEDFLHMVQGRGSAAAAWDPAMGPRAAGGAGAPSSRTPSHPTPTAMRAAPRTSTRTLLSAQATITYYCAGDGRAGACLAAASHSPHLRGGIRAQTRSASFRTGIAAGHLPAHRARGHCADPLGNQSAQPITLPHALSPKRTETSAPCRNQMP